MLAQNINHQKKPSEDKKNNKKSFDGSRSSIFGSNKHKILSEEKE